MHACPWIFILFAEYLPLRVYQERYIFITLRKIQTRCMNFITTSSSGKRTTIHPYLCCLCLLFYSLRDVYIGKVLLHTVDNFMRVRDKYQVCNLTSIVSYNLCSCTVYTGRFHRKGTVRFTGKREYSNMHS